MKTTISLFTFLLIVISANAQGIKSSINQNTNKAIVTNNKPKDNTVAKENRKSIKISVNDDVLRYSKISKVTFYEALIRLNDFDIQLMDSENTALRCDEDIHINDKERISSF